MAFGGCIKNSIPNEPHAAGSFIKLENRLLVVEDVWSGKLSLPGGSQKEDESLEETARRETLEETGILVTVGKELHRTADFVLFQCDTVNPVFAMKRGYPKDKASLYWIPHSHSSRNEIEKVLLIDPMLYKPQEFRFPSQLETIQKLFENMGKVSGNLQIIEKPLRRTSKMEDFGIRVIRGFQKFDGRITQAIFNIFSFLGSGWVIFLTVPYFLLCTPPKQGQGFFLLLVISSLINGLLKDAFGLTRPFEIAPSVQWMEASGFGFPSGHTQLATVFWGCIFWRVRSAMIKATLITIILMVGFSRIYFGVHYPHDVAGGWFLGAVILSVYYVFTSRETVQFFDHRQYFCWWIFLCVTFISVLLRFHPDTVAILALWFGVLWGRILGGKSVIRILLPFDFRQKAIRTLVGILGMVFIFLTFYFITPEDKRFFTQFSVLLLKHFCLGIWLRWGSFMVVDSLVK